MALISGSTVVPDALFPELKVDEEVEDEEFPDEEVAVKYVFADDAKYDPKQIEEEMRAMAAAAAIGGGTSNFGSAVTYTDWV